MCTNVEVVEKNVAIWVAGRYKSTLRAVTKLLYLQLLFTLI